MTQLARRDDEAAALVRLGFDELHGFARSVGTTERDIAARVFRYVPAGKPIQFVHDAVNSGVVGAFGGATRALGRGAGTVVERRPRPARPLSATVPGSLGLAVLNGLVGDRLERERSPLQEPISVRVDGLPVAPERDALAAAFPAATPRLVVFVHGLMGNEVGWRLGRRQGREPYGSQARRRPRLHPGLRPLQQRPPHLRERPLAGRPARGRGRRLAGRGDRGRAGRALDGRARLAQRLPPRGQGRRGLGQHVRKVVSLGSPHLGAPLEQTVHVASYAANLLPETRMFSTFLRRRSSGIRDLRQGSLVDEDWRDRDPEALRAAACEEVPLLEGATHCFVSATVTRSPRHPVGRVVGDTLVLQPSASGRSRTRKLGFEDEHGLHIGATNHIALLNHPAVYEKLREWLR